MFNARTAELWAHVVIWYENPEDFNYDLLSRRAGSFRPGRTDFGR